MKKSILIALSLFLLGQGGARGEESLTPCTNMSGCKKGEICALAISGSSKYCFQKCKTSTDCPKGFYCSPNGPVCRTNCVKNSDCPSGKTCVEDGVSCRKVEIKGEWRWHCTQLYICK